MTDSAAFFDRDPDELAELLIQTARRERAPHQARDRALASVAAASLSVAVATSAKATLAAPALTKGSGMLAVKWLAIGLGGALVGLTAVDQAQRALAPAAESAAAPPAAAKPATRAAAPVTHAQPVPVVPDPAPALPVDARGRPAAPFVSAAPTAAPLLAPSAADFAPSVTPLAREVTALRQARAALADAKPSRALEILAAHRREFPVGVLATEESALRVEIAFALGDARARELAWRFLEEHPASPLAARVQGLLESQKPSGDKP